MLCMHWWRVNSGRFGALNRGANAVTKEVINTPTDIIITVYEHGTAATDGQILYTPSPLTISFSALCCPSHPSHLQPRHHQYPYA